MIEERRPSLSAVGAAMIALETEYDALERDIDSLLRRVGLAMKKQRICLDTLQSLAQGINQSTHPTGYTQF